jgi:hypothetical protein
MTLGDLRAAIERLPLFDRGNGPDEGDPDRYTVSLARVLELIDSADPSRCPFDGQANSHYSSGIEGVRDHRWPS